MITNTYAIDNMTSRQPPAMPLFRCSSRPCPQPVYVVAYNPTFDPDIPYQVFSMTSRHQICTGTRLIIGLSRMPTDFRVTARVGSVHWIEQQHVVFRVRDCEYDIHRIAIPIFWVSLNRFDTYRFRHELHNIEEPNFDTHSDSDIHPNTQLTITQRALRNVASMATIIAVGRRMDEEQEN